VELTEDPRFLRGIALFNDGDYLEASDCFEELFFEGVRDEPDFTTRKQGNGVRRWPEPRRGCAS
jgi:hypothetical protein